MKKYYSNKTAKEILTNPKNFAICYGGFRQIDRNIEPTIEQIREDIKILEAIGIKIIRTYNVHYQEVYNLLKVISELKKENPKFEMYLMLGVWIDCKNARTNNPLHDQESDTNSIEIERAVKLANQYPDIVKMIAVGNEAMVKWATSYYVEPKIILKWVKYLQDLKKKGNLPKDLWITSSDNFASWGGGSKDYHTEDLNELIKSVDFISIHTYPMHDTHYNPSFWGISKDEEKYSKIEAISFAMNRAKEYAVNQYESVVMYVRSLGVDKIIVIGETGWASIDDKLYGPNGSKAVDEYKSALYYKLTREWTEQKGLICFYFEAFDEQWKDAKNPFGSENHFGLINLNSQAKFMLWDMCDKGVFKGLIRDSKPITKTYNGDLNLLLQDVEVPPTNLNL